MSAIDSFISSNEKEVEFYVELGLNVVIFFGHRPESVTELIFTSLGVHYGAKLITELILKRKPTTIGQNMSQSFLN